MFRSLYDKVQRQRDLTEEDRIALLEQWRKSGAKPEITSWWKSVIYVNQETGSDDNLGTSFAPLKSLQTAIDMIPPGGIGTIVLSSDYTLEYVKTGKNKVIYLVGSHLDSDGNPVITLRNDTQNSTSRILIEDGTKLLIRRLIVEANNNGNSAVHWSTLLKVMQSAGIAVFIGEWNNTRDTKVILNNPLINVETSIITLSLRYCDVNASSSQNLVATWGAGHLLFAAENVVADDTVTLPNTGWN